MMTPERNEIQSQDVSDTSEATANPLVTEILSTPRALSVREISARFTGNSIPITETEHQRRVQAFRKIPSFATVSRRSLKNMNSPRKILLMKEWSKVVVDENVDSVTPESALSFLAQYDVTKQTMDEESWNEWLEAIDNATANTNESIQVKQQEQLQQELEQESQQQQLSSQTDSSSDNHSQLIGRVDISHFQNRPPRQSVRKNAVEGEDDKSTTAGKTVRGSICIRDDEEIHEYRASPEMMTTPSLNHPPNRSGSHTYQDKNNDSEEEHERLQISTVFTPQAATTPADAGTPNSINSPDTECSSVYADSVTSWTNTTPIRTDNKNVSHRDAPNTGASSVYADSITSWTNTTPLPDGTKNTTRTPHTGVSSVYAGSVMSWEAVTPVHTKDTTTNTTISGSDSRASQKNDLNFDLEHEHEHEHEQEQTHRTETQKPAKQVNNTNTIRDVDNVDGDTVHNPLSGGSANTPNKQGVQMSSTTTTGTGASANNSQSMQRDASAAQESSSTNNNNNNDTKKSGGLFNCFGCC